MLGINTSVFVLQIINQTKCCLTLSITFADCKSTFVTNSGATLFVWKVFIMASGVTVSMSVEMLMAALLIRQFSPLLPTMDCTSVKAELILCWLSVSVKMTENFEQKIICRLQPCKYQYG